jgi:serine/threonine protein kinase
MEAKCELGKELGKGNYATVYQSANGKSAIKAFDEYYLNMAEIDILFRLKSDYLLQGEQLFNKKACREDIQFAMQITLIKGSLIDLAIPSLRYSLRKRLCYDYALSLQALHHHGYLHLDISKGNCFFHGTKENPQGLLGDYGISAAALRSSKGELKVTTVQLRYSYNARDPLAEGKKDERLPWGRSFNYTNRSDVYALGFIFVYLMSGVDFFAHFDKRWHILVKKPGVSFDKQVRELILRLLHPDHIREHLDEILLEDAKEDDPFYDLVIKMLSLNYDDRPSIDQVLSHSFFSEFEETAVVTEYAPVSLQLPVEKGVKSGLRIGEIKDSKDLEKLARIVLETEWPPFNVELLFTTIDLFYRSQNVLPDLDPEIRRIVAFSIVVKLFYSIGDFEWVDTLPKDYSNPEDRYKKYDPPERAIIIGLDGILRTNVCKYAQSIEELQEFFHDLLEGKINYFGERPELSFNRIRERLSDQVQHDISYDARDAFLDILSKHGQFEKSEGEE